MERERDEIILPPEFSGSGQLLLFTRYGDPRTRGWESKWIQSWEVQNTYPWFPQKEINIHKDFKPLLNEAFKELEAKSIFAEIKSIHDCYCVRNIRGSDVLSVHSWGAGIDMNAPENPLGSLGTWSETFIEIMSINGIFCGQTWEGRKNPMHFAMVNS